MPIILPSVAHSRSLLLCVRAAPYLLCSMRPDPIRRYEKLPLQELEMEGLNSNQGAGRDAEGQEDEGEDWDDWDEDGEEGDGWGEDDSLNLSSLSLNDHER